MSSPEVLRDLVDDSIESKVFSAAACALVTPTGAKVKIVRGLSDPDRNEQATSTSLFDLASLTKPIATGSLLVKALELGLISLAEKATKWIPDAQYLKDVTVSHLIGHVSGLPSWKALYQTPDKSAIEQIAATPLKRPSGTEYEYSDLGYILLGEILAQVYGQSLDEAAKKYIFAPLKLNSTTYRPNEAQQKRAVVTGHSRSRPESTLKGQVHDENAWWMGGVAGHAGLFSTIDDLMTYVRCLLNEGQGLFSPQATERFLSPHVRLDGQLGWHCLGWFAEPNEMLPRGDLFSRQVVGHSGFTGTAIVIDRTRKSAVIVLTNHVLYTPEKAEWLIVRRKMINVLAAMQEL
ncbi:MAG: serine hydrolase [Armatimonadetes bacterium]|nr:serine hydrolase [Armatimonadota bacterium]